MKKFGLILSLCMILSLTTVSALEIQTVWEGFDPHTVADGNDAYWTTNLSVYSDNTHGSGLIAPTGSGTKTTSDATYGQSTVSKREWGKITAKNAITSTDGNKYELTFRLTGIEGSYPAAFGGCYVYLRSSTMSNYLDNRFAIIVRRNHNGVPQIGLKTASQGATTDSYLPIGAEGVTMLDTTVKVVDDFTSGIIRVYATDSNGEFQLVGTVTLDLDTNSATLENAAGTTLTRTGYANSISADSTTPMFILAEYGTMISDIKVRYPLFDLSGATATVASGTYMGVPEPELATSDSGAEIFYTIDGTDPRDSATAEEYTSGIVDFGNVGEEYPITLTLKAATHLNGDYSEVNSYTYTVIAPEAYYPLEPAKLAEAADPYWSGREGFETASFEEGGEAVDAVTVPTVNGWTYFTPKFTMPAAVETYEYKFTTKGLISDGFKKSGIYIPIKAASLGYFMVDSDKAFVFISKNGIGFRNSSAWSNNATDSLGFGEDIDMSADTHTVRVFVTPGSTEETAKVFIDNLLVGTYALEGETLTLTNADGETISRDGITSVNDGFIPGMAVAHTTPYIKDFSVFYPAENAATDADKSDLGELIEEVKALEGEEYEGAEYAALLYELKDAERVFENVFVYQAEVDEAYNALLSAKNALVSTERDYKTYFNEDFASTDMDTLNAQDWEFSLPVHEFIADGALTTDGVNGRFALTPVIPADSNVEINVKYGTAESAAVMLRQSGNDRTYLNSYRDETAKFFGSEGIAVHIKAEGNEETELTIAFPEREGTGYEKVTLTLPESVSFADTEKLTIADRGEYIEFYVADTLVATAVFDPTAKENGVYTGAMLLDANGNVLRTPEGINVPERGRVIFSSKSGTMSVDSVLCSANVNGVDIAALEVACTPVAVYGKGTLSTIAVYENGVKAEVANVTYTSLTPELILVDEEGNVTGLAIGTGRVKAEYAQTQQEIEIEVEPIRLAAVLNETDAPVEITEAQAENYDKVFYGFENIESVTVPAGAEGNADLYIRAKGDGAVSVKVNGALTEAVTLNSEEFANHKITVSLEKGLNTVEAVTTASVDGIYVQRLEGELPVKILTGISLSKNGYSFTVSDTGEEVPVVTAEYFGGDTHTVTAEFTSNNPGIALVQNGKIVPGGNDGEAVISAAYTENGITKKATINVSVTLSENIRIADGLRSAEANATKGYDGAYSESSNPQFAIDGNADTVWTSGSAGEYLEGHENDEAVYLSVKLDGLHSVDRVMLSLAEENVDTEKILGVWIDTRQMTEDTLSPYANEGSWQFVEKADLTVLTDVIGKTVKLVFDEPEVIQYVAIAFDKTAEVSVSEIKIYEDISVPATEAAESLTFKNDKIADGKITLSQGEEMAIVLQKNYPRLDSVTVDTYTPSYSDSTIAWIEDGVLKTDAAGECIITTAVDGLEAVLEVTVEPMADIVCLNASGFINMAPDDTAKIELEKGVYKIKYLSENTAVATVDGEGNVTAAGTGKTRIKIYSEVSGTQPAYITVNVSLQAGEEEILSEDFESSTSLPSGWSYFTWQGVTHEIIETINGENYMNIGYHPEDGGWIGGAIPNTVITAEKYTVKLSAGVTGSTGIIYLRLPEVISSVLAYTGESDWASPNRYGRDGIAFNLFGENTLGITLRSKELVNNYPKAINIDVPIPDGVIFTNGSFADFRFDDAGNTVTVTAGGNPLCRIVFTNVVADSDDSARVLADGYVENSAGENIGNFSGASLPGGNYKVGFGSRGKVLYLNNLEVVTGTAPEISNAADFKVIELGDEEKKISVTQYGESYLGEIEFESADTNIVMVDVEGNASFVGRGTTSVYVYTQAGNLCLPVTVLGEEDISDIVSRIAATESWSEAKELYEELENSYNLDFSAITNEALSDRFVEELRLDSPDDYSKLSDIENKIDFAKKVEEIVAAASDSGSGDELEKVVMKYDDELTLDLTNYDKINSTNIRGQMWTALYTELNGGAVNSETIKEKFEAFAEDYYEIYQESKDDDDKGGGGGGSTGSGGMIYTDYTQAQPVTKAYYTDLSGSHWAKPYIEALTDMGIVSGYTDRTVNPDGKITREEAVTVIIKAFIKKTAEGTLSEGDPSSEWAVPYLLSAKENGLIIGDEKGFVNGRSNATRAEMAVLVARLMGISEGNTELLTAFSDFENIPSWASVAFAALNEKGIIGGYEDGSLRPNGDITRAEFFTIIYKIISNN